MYFRITGYEPKNDISFILDCNGKFEKLWQFSAFVISKGCKVLEVSNSGNFIDITLTKAEYDTKHIFLRAIQKGKPEYTTYSLNDTEHKAVRIDKHLYIPEKT